MYIWADGICINQHDNIEKAQQVLLMGEIYSIAHHTVICLGPGDSTSGDILRRVQECFDNDNYSSVELDVFLVRGLRKILNSPWFFRIWVLQELVLSRDPRIQWGRACCTWEALSQMVNLLRLSRSMPEIRNATRESGRARPEETVSVSGLRNQYAMTPVPNNLEFPQNQDSTSSNFQILEIPKPQAPPKSSVHVLELPQNDVLERMQAAKNAHDYAVLEDKANRRRHPRMSRLLSLDVQRRDLKRLLEIMASRAGLGVSDPRDMVYAHLGLAKHARIQVDYTKTIAEVYHDLVMEAINAFGNLRILGFVLDSNLDQRGTLTFSQDGITAPSEEKLASWAPNWTVPHARVSYSIMEHVGYGFDLPGESSLPSCFLSQPPLLCVKGWVICTLSEVGPVLGNIETLRERDVPLYFPRADVDWLMDIPGLPRKAVQLMWENFVPGFPLQSHAGYGGHAQMVIDHLWGRRFITSEKSIIDGRRLAILDNGSFKRRLALVPMCADNGDRVCFFDGCPVPFVIRDTGTLDQSISDQIVKRMNRRNYKDAEHLKPVKLVKLVGECFVDDFMYGNNRRARMNHPWELVTIC